MTTFGIDEPKGTAEENHIGKEQLVCNLLTQAALDALRAQLNRHGIYQITSPKYSFSYDRLDEDIVRKFGVVHDGSFRHKDCSYWELRFTAVGAAAETLVEINPLKTLSVSIEVYFDDESGSIYLANDEELQEATENLRAWMHYALSSDEIEGVCEFLRSSGQLEHGLGYNPSLVAKIWRSTLDVVKGFLREPHLAY